MSDSLVLRSSIHPELKRSTLIRGSFIAGLGVGMMFVAGTFMPVSILQSWGLLIFGLSVGLIAWGLIPYRKLTYLELHPHRVEISDEQWMHLFLRKKHYRIPLDEIHHISQYQTDKKYGITLHMKSDPRKELDLPFFTTRSLERLSLVIIGKRS